MRHDAPIRLSGSPAPVCNNRGMRPTNEDIRAAVERVLSSPSFLGASRLSRFLGFVIERTLAGEGDRLKEYAIGVEVFDRDEHYDPRIDSIVRVEAGRLRTKLEEYYRGAGASDAVEIRIQRGGYVPEFELRPRAVQSSAAPATTAGPAAHGVQVNRATDLRFRGLLAGGIALAGALVAAIYWRDLDRAQSDAPVIAVLPFQPYSDEESARMLATRLTEGISAELVRLDRFSVVPSTSARELADTRGSLRDVARALEADFLLEGRVLADSAAVRVEARLIDGTGNRKIWVDTIAGDVADLDDLVRRVAAAAAAAPLSSAR